MTLPHINDILQPKVRTEIIATAAGIAVSSDGVPLVRTQQTVCAHTVALCDAGNTKQIGKLRDGMMAGHVLWRALGGAVRAQRTGAATLPSMHWRQ